MQEIHSYILEHTVNTLQDSGSNEFAHLAHFTPAKCGRGIERSAS